MNCDDFQSSLSARFDGELEPERLALHERHAATCTACASAWSDFERSTRALRGLGVASLDDEQVGSLVATALAAAALPPASARGRGGGGWIGHGLSLLAGAALVLIFLGLRREGPPLSPAEGGEAPPAPVGRWTLDARPWTPAAGERLRIEPGALLSYRGPNGERVDVEGAALLEPPPRIEVVERVVERVEVVPLPAATPGPAELASFERALNFFGEACLRLGESIDREPPRPEGIAASEEAAPPSASPQPAREPRLPRRDDPDSSAVVVQRDGDSLILETRGSLDEVVPALIARFGDGDPEVSRLVERRLREIWAEETGGALEDAPVSSAPREDEVRGRFGWRRWVASDARVEEEPPHPGALWSRWWRDHRGSPWVSSL